MAIEMEDAQLEESEIITEEKEPFIQASSEDENLGNFPNIQDSSLKKSEFQPMEVATTRYFMQQLKYSLLVTKPEAPSDNEVDSESPNNVYTRRRHRSAAAVQLIYSDDEKESEDSEYSPDVLSPSSEDSSDSWTDEWVPPTKKKKKMQKKKQNLPDAHSSNLHQSSSSVVTNESIQKQSSDSIDQCFVCEVCDKTFESKRGLLIHTVRIHSSSNSQHQSDSSVVTNETIQNQNCDSTNRCFVCEVCNKTFDDKKSLLVHTNKVHISDKPYACNSCDKTFASSSNLQKHVRVHTHEKPYSCTICDKRFADGSNMRKHMEIHGVPHVCTGCDKELQQSFGIQSYETIHDNCSSVCRNNSSVSLCEKPQESQVETNDEEQSYECKKCGSNFTVKTAFEKHLKLHEICKNFQCAICEKCFCSTNDLLRHEVMSHGKVQQKHEENENKIHEENQSESKIHEENQSESKIHEEENQSENKMPKENRNENNKIETSDEQVASVICTSSENCPKNSIPSTQLKKTVEISQRISDVSQEPIVLNGNELPASLNHLQKSEEICIPATNQNELPILLEQYDIQPLTEIEKLNSFADVQTQLTNYENEKLPLSFQQSESKGLGSRNVHFSLGFQKTNVADLVDKQKATYSLNVYHQLSESILNGKENAHERRGTNQWEQKNGSVSDKHESEASVLGLIQNVLPTNNLFSQRLHFVQEDNHYSTCEIENKSEEDMNSLGIFFEN